MKFLVATLLTAGLFAGCTRNTPAENAAAAHLAPVRAQVVTVLTAPLPVITEVTGTVRPLQRAQLAAKLMGVIVELPVTLGERVRQGQVLVKLGAAEINARLVQAQSQLNAAERDLNRERDLLAKGASTADLVRGLEDRYTGAKAMVQEAEVMLGYATLRAPFDGVIARKQANAGDLATPGTPLLEIEGTTAFEVEAGVPDSLAATLQVGTPVQVRLPDGGATLTGRLTELSSAADATARTVTVKIALPAAANVRSGQFARVQLPGAPEPALLVPASAVAEIGQMERLYVAGADNRAALRLVKTGARRDGHVEILAGVDSGERVIARVPAGLRDGQALEIAP